MNGLSLEFEGSAGQNEPGIFQGGNALLTQTFFSHATYMNGLSLEFEGSRGQNEHGNFLWGNASKRFRDGY